MRSMKSNSGFTSLGFIVSSMSAVFAVGLMFNLSSIVTSKSAIDAAARRAARCLSATDPAEGCTATSFNADSGVSNTEDWFH